MMPHSLKPNFSVAKSPIEDAGKGAEHPVCAPLRLSSIQMTPVMKFASSPFGNPFSMPCHAFPKLLENIYLSHAPVNSLLPPASSSKSHSFSSQVSVSISDIFPSPAPVLSASSSSHVRSPFPNPFLIKRNLDHHSASVVTAKPTAVSSTSFYHSPSRNFQTFGTSNLPIPRTLSATSQNPNTLTLARRPRKPRPDRVLVPNSFRPRVMAVDRLFSWHTPYGLSHDASLLTELPPVLVESAKMSITGAFATSSKSTYAAGLLRFNQFCDKWQISEHARMPASYTLLCAFIGNHKGTVSGRTIKSWLSGLRAWHLTNHAPWYGDDKWVQMARISANKEGSRHKRPLRAPVSIEHLLALRRAITLSNHFHAAIWAVALVTFFGCRRLGETTVSSVSSFDPSLHVLRSAEYAQVDHNIISYLLMILCSVSFNNFRDGSRSASFRIPWTKTTREEGASIIVTARNDQICPCTALRNHLDTNQDVPGTSSLFAYTTANSRWEHMTKSKFMDFCATVWREAALTHVLGHSFRIGGAVELLLAGVSPEIVAATGSWTSLAFLLYWRRMEEILPMCTSRAYQKSHLEALAKIFEKFRVDCHIPSNLVAIHDSVDDF